jgi:hypothetical protein
VRRMVAGARGCGSDVTKIISVLHFGQAAVRFSDMKSLDLKVAI